PARSVFGTEPLDLTHFAIAIAGTLVVMGAVEAWKLRLRLSGTKY
ncbi:hypothetical protein MNBD_ACTINO01-813, partial [hydrothermal vent metagenome]